MIKMDHEEMKAVFMRQNERYIRRMKNERDVDIRKGLYMSSRGALFLASLLCLVDAEEQMVLLDGLERCMYPELFPFKEVSADEWETFQIDDLPVPEVMEKSPEEAESEAGEMQKLLKKQYDLYVDVIREERDKDMCRTYHGKVSGMLDFAMELGIIDFAESFCMYNDMNKIADESFSRCEDPLETLRNAIKSGEYIDADIARIKVDEQYELMKFNFGHPGCSNEMDLHFMHGYMRCVADIGVMSEDDEEEAIKELAGLFEVNGNKLVEISVLGVPAMLEEKDVDSYIEKLVSSVIKKAVIIRPEVPGLHKEKANSEKCE